MVSSELFREYDIRGIVDRDLTEDAVTLIGRAFGTIVRRGGGSFITCGRDGRLHSERLENALVRGLNMAGVDVVDIGQCPTPVLYFSIFHLKGSGGIQITGSHNPPEYNGLKMCIGTETIYGRRILQLYEIIEKGDFEKGDGSVKTHDILPDYLSYLKENINIRRPVNIVLDCGNGVAALTAPQAFSQQGCRAACLFCEVDGRFPNHHPDPTVLENLDDLKKAVLNENAELGIAFDGDGDRIGVVDENGNVIYGDKILMILARSLLSEHPGAAVIGEVKCSHLLYNDIEAHGGRPVMWKTGHSLIKQKMKETGALLAGEMSGHIFFADRYYGFDDATYAALRLAEIIAAADRPLSRFLQDVPETVSTPEIRVECPEKIKFEIVDQARKWFDEHYDTIDVDGVRIVFPDGWGLIRASNTQPVLVLRFEAETPERLDEIRRLVEGKLSEIRSRFENGQKK